MKKTIPHIQFKRRRLNGSSPTATVLPPSVPTPAPVSFAPDEPRPTTLRRRLGSPPRVKPTASNDRADALKERLKSAFPAVFGSLPRPLKVGIHKDIWQRLPDVDHTLLDAFLSKYTRQTDYLRALASGGQRFDLDGHVVEPISSFAQAQSSQRLANTRRHKD
jgi:hypothetical protein